MAIDYELEASPVLDQTRMLDYFADLLGCDDRFEEPGAPTRAARREVVLTSLEWSREDEPESAELFGVDRVASMTFRMDKSLTGEEHAATFRDILAACAKFLEDHPEAKAVFSFQFEDIYLQRLDTQGIVLSERLRGPDFNVDGVLDELLAKYPAIDLGRVEDLPAD
jgi:hypothetical protein